MENTYKFLDSLKKVLSWLEDELSREVFGAKLHDILTGDKSIYATMAKKSGVQLQSLEKLFVDKQPIIVYGVGRRGEGTVKLLQTFAPNVKYVLCDRNYKEIGIKCGIQVLSPEIAINQYKKSVILITPKEGVEEIAADLLSCGAKKSKVYYYADTIERYVQQMYECQYFDPLVLFGSNEIFADVGVFNGMTSVEFARKCNGQYKQIYMFEAEENKKSDIQSAIVTYGLKNVELHMKGLWDCKDVLTFSSELGGGSTVTDTGNMTIEVDTLDNLLHGRPITFLKMDIEGAELNALKGAKETIQTHKPKLAICIYHKAEDILEIPMYIKKLVPEYKLYIRHYSCGDTETVLYAIP